MANQLEDDVQRVLDLARSRSLSCHARVKIAAKKLRHRHGAEQNPSRATLMKAKMQGLAAIYALDKTSRHLADCSASSVLRHQITANNNSQETTDDSAILQRKLDARRELYKLHYSGSGLATATCSSTGLTKLESLIEAAQQAVKIASRHLAVRIGAAVLTSRHRIISACAVESLSNDKYSVCAEHAAILKMLTTTSSEHDQYLQDDVEVIEAVTICSDRQDDTLPYPCGGCREYMAGLGDFPVYLLNFGGGSDETRSFELFPGARHAKITQITKRVSTYNTPISEVRHQPATTNRSGDNTKFTGQDTTDLPMDVTQWTIEHVARWVVDDVELPQYRDVFLRNKVDGCVLAHLEDCDLQLLLGIAHPLHRKRLLVHLDRLRDRELLEHGIDYGQLQDYLAVLDRDRIAVVARLKAAFDRLDVNKDGFLDFARVHEALKSVGGDAVSPQAVEQLLRNENLFGDDAKDGKIAFPSFATAFSTLAMQPASEKRDAGLVGRCNADKSTKQQEPRLPLVDLKALRGSFDKVDADGSGHIDEKELIQLFQSLGHDQQIADEKAREWFKSADMDGDASLSFAEFLLRYLQLSKIDVRKLRTLFDAAEPLSSTKLKPRNVVRRSLAKLFPEIATLDIDGWTESFFHSDNNTSAGKESLTATFADFVLACFAFNAEAADRKTGAASREIGQLLRNDSLAHRSRIVHLQQQGHVRLCSQGRELRQLRRGHVEAQQQRLEQIRKQQQQRMVTSIRIRNREIERDGKRGDSEDEEAEMRSLKQQREREVDDTFNRFGKKNRNREERMESKHNDSDEERDESISVVEAAQAALELGAALSREQIVRYLQSLGFDLHHLLSRRDFRRVIAHLDAKERVASGAAADSNIWKIDSIPSTQGTTEYSSSGRKHGSSGKHRGVSRKDYEERLLAQHYKSKATPGSKASPTQMLRGISTRTQETRRSIKGDREHPRHSKRKDAEESKGDSTDSDSSDNGHSLRRKVIHHRRSGSEDSDRPSSASSDRHQRRSRPRSRSRHSTSRHQSRSHRRLFDSSSSESTDSTASSPRSKSPPSDFGVAQQHQSGFCEGDRVRHKPSDALGSILRVYRDYFVADVLFDSGRRLKNVDLASLQRTPASSNRPHQQWKRGFAVLVPYKRGLKAGSALRRGKIVKCRTDGTFDVLLDEFGESETLARVPMSLLRVARRKQPAFYGVGAKVTVRQRSEYLRGTVAVCRTDGSYDIRLRGGSRTLPKVAAELLSLDDDEDYDEDERDNKVVAEGSEKRQTSRSDSEDEAPKRRLKIESDSDDSDKRANTSIKKLEEDTFDDFEPEFDKGDRVEARFNGGSAFFPGKIARMYTDNTYDIAYDDGDEEMGVPSRFIRTAKSSPAVSNTPKSTTATTSKPAKRDDYDDDLFESD